jgi:hypothetical protein
MLAAGEYSRVLQLAWWQSLYSEFHIRLFQTYMAPEKPLDMMYMRLTNASGSAVRLIVPKRVTRQW